MTQTSEESDQASEKLRVDGTYCPNQSEYSEELDVAQKASIGTAFVLALLINALVLWSVLNMSKQRHLNRMHKMIVYLSCADLFVAIFNILPHVIVIHHRGIIYGGTFVCGFIPYIQTVAMYASSFVLIAASTDRYLAICHPIRFHASVVTSQPFLVGAAWIASMALALPQTLVFSSISMEVVDQVAPVAICRYLIDGGLQRMCYIIYYAITIYVAPVLILAALNAHICIVVWRNSIQTQSETGNRKFCNHGTKRRRKSEKNESRYRTSLVSLEENVREQEYCMPRVHQQRMSKAKVKTVKLTLAIVVSYFVCWGPFFFCSVWVSWNPCPYNQASAAERAPVVLIMDLASITSCINPIVCLAFNKTIRRHVSCTPVSDSDPAHSTKFASSIRSTVHGLSQQRRSSYPARKYSAVALEVLGCRNSISIEKQRLRTKTGSSRLSC